MNLSVTTTEQSWYRYTLQSRLLILLVALVLLFCNAAFGQQVKSAEGESSFSVIVSGATNVIRHELRGGRQQMSYHVQAEYPAQDVLDTIRRELKQRGWSPLPADFFNPGVASSIVRGWDYYEDHASKPKTSVRVWQADWRRQRELVTYRLEYRCPGTLCASTYDLRDLRVIAIYIPRLEGTNH
jgi:hypothetical protein